MKVFKAFIIMMVVLLLAVSAHAGVESADGELNLFVEGTTILTDDGDGYAPIGLSPKVQAFYVSNGGTVTESQWYAISTGHPGGNKVYATAQDVNNIFSKSYTTADEMSTYLQSIPTDPQSASVWTTNEWDL